MQNRPNIKTFKTQHTLGAKGYELSNHLGNVQVVVTDKKFERDIDDDDTIDVYAPSLTAAYDYYPFGMLMPGRYVRDTTKLGWRHKFNGMEADDELKGLGNSLDFGARMYSGRLGRWLSTDNIAKGYLSSYQFGKNNPIINIDPDGNTEYYFQGKWVGSDGVTTTLIGIVKSKDISKQIKKGEYKFPLELTNGSNGTDAFIIDVDVLRKSNEILGLSLSKSGRNREYGTRMNKDINGKYIDNGISEGGTVDLNSSENKIATVEITGKGGVKVHSHPTGSGVSGDNRIQSFDALDPGPEDHIFEGEEMMIIVGKNGDVNGTLYPNGGIDGKDLVVPDDTRKKDGAINVFTPESGNNKPAQTISGREATNILSDYKNR